MSDNENFHILVVDDEESLRLLLKQLLEEVGYSVEVAESGEEALKIFRNNPFHIILTDIRMEGMSGLDLLKEAREINSQTEVIIMTSHVSIETAVEALRLGAYDYLIKPFDNLDMVLALIKRAIEKIKLVSANQNLVENLKSKNSELENLNESIHEMAIRDGLTSLYNHRHFYEVLGAEIERSRRSKHRLSLLMLDVDNFKTYNDTNGHPKGDEVLKTLGKILTDRARKCDFVARYGGEEFVVLLPETPKELGYKVAEDFRKLVENHPFPHGESQPLGKVSFSGGLAEYPGDAEDVKTLVNQADLALYEAKGAGRNCVKNAKPQKNKHGVTKK